MVFCLPQTGFKRVLNFVRPVSSYRPATLPWAPGANPQSDCAVIGWNSLHVNKRQQPISEDFSISEAFSSRNAPSVSQQEGMYVVYTTTIVPVSTLYTLLKVHCKVDTG